VRELRNSRIQLKFRAFLHVTICRSVRGLGFLFSEDLASEGEEDFSCGPFSAEERPYQYAFLRSQSSPASLATFGERIGRCLRV